MINKYIQAYSLRNAYRAKTRQARMTNFESIKTIGLLSNPKSQVEIQELDQVIEYFEKLDKHIFPLIYIDNKMKNDVFTKKISWTVFGKENCNWYGKPRKEINLNHFKNKEFDILIDLSFLENFSLKSIFIQSKARLKIMHSSNSSKQFADFMFKSSNPQNKLIFVKELIHYLTIINKNQK